jgi:hypothetical protein
MFTLEDSDLWKQSLAPRSGDENEEARTSLRTALLKMRASVSSLISEVPADCKGLTIHDVSHLDALWEMADLVAGPDYKLNPVEAFVFGASVLLHDAALTFIAYPGGLASLKETSIWKDLEASQKRQLNIQDRREDVDYDSIAFEVLRQLHAQQSEHLATQSWPIGSKGDKIYLLEDSELRMSYGRSIGRIAHSHHWSIDRVAEELRDDVGASPALPKEWTLSERKIACLLRCSDIAHLDRRRAPTILLAAKDLSESSKPHWQFQNKINKPVFRDSALYYSSGESFGLDEADAWWLAYDTLKAVDSEIRNSNSLLSEQRLPQFDAQRVAGAETPRSLSKLITTDGWRPVDTEIKVSDPVHLAKTLGGANLYGDDTLAPIRELLQNAVDAVRARRRFEKRPPDWGQVKIAIEEDGEGARWLIVDDTGIGMSERVLTGPLVDFGKSLWTSNLLQEEFPGLQSEGLAPVGKFGIGFFSAFLLGQKISVTTSKIRSSDGLKTLEFNGIGKRPLLRDAKPDEVRLDYTTRIRVKLDNPNILSSYLTVKDGEYSQSTREIETSSAIMTMISCLDVDVSFEDRFNDISIEHKSGWLDSSALDFLSSSNADGRSSEDIAHIADVHREMLQPLVGSDGTIFGRAALNLVPGGRVGSSFARIAVGGFTNLHRVNAFDFYVGTLAGKTKVASRATAHLDVPNEVLADWASNQVSIIDKTKLHPADQLTICHNVVRLDGDPGDLPFCLGSNGLLTVHQLRALLAKSSSIAIPVAYVTREYRHVEKHFEHVSLFSLGGHILFYKLKEGFFAISDANHDLFYETPEEEEISDAIETQGHVSVGFDDIFARGEMLAFRREVRRAWGTSFTMKLEPEDFIDMKVYRDDEERWALRFERSDS